MKVSPRAGTPAEASMLVNVPGLVTAVGEARTRAGEAHRPRGREALRDKIERRRADPVFRERVDGSVRCQEP